MIKLIQSFVILICAVGSLSFAQWNNRPPIIFERQSSRDKEVNEAFEMCMDQHPNSSVPRSYLYFSVDAIDEINVNNPDRLGEDFSNCSLEQMLLVLANLELLPENHYNIAAYLLNKASYFEPCYRGRDIDIVPGHVYESNISMACEPEDVINIVLYNIERNRMEMGNDQEFYSNLSYNAYDIYAIYITQKVPLHVKFR